MINLDVKQSKEHMGFRIDRNTAVHFDSFVIEYIPQKILRKIKDESITHNIFRMQSYDFVMCGFYCIPLTEKMI